MKKLVFSIAFLCFVAVNVAAQTGNSNLENETNNNLLSDFLSYVIRQQHSETRQSGWLFGLYAQGGFTMGGIRNSEATMSYGLSARSGQIGVGIRRQINATHSITASVGFSSSVFDIRNGLYHHILGENNPLANYLVGNDVSSFGETFSRMGMEFALGYRFNFGRDRRFGDIGSYVELGVFSTLFPVNSRYSTSIMVAMPDGKSSQSLDIVYRGLSIMSPETGIQATVGWNSFAIYGRYRLTNPLSRIDSDTAVLPPFTFGIRIGF